MLKRLIWDFQFRTFFNGNIIFLMEILLFQWTIEIDANVNESVAVAEFFDK